MQRVLPQLNDRAASFCRRRIRLFHWENLRRERSRCHQEFRRAQDRHVKTKIIPQLRIVSRLRSMRSDNQSQSLETFSSQSFLRNASRKKILSRMSSLNVEGFLSKDRRMLRHCCLQQQSATVARYSPFRIIVCKSIQLLWRANFSSISRCKCSAIAG